MTCDRCHRPLHAPSDFLLRVEGTDLCVTCWAVDRLTRCAVGHQPVWFAGAPCPLCQARATFEDIQRRCDRLLALIPTRQTEPDDALPPGGVPYQSDLVEEDWP